MRLPRASESATIPSMCISPIGVAHQEHKAHIFLPLIDMKALILGGGPAGLVAALRLKQALGVHPVVYEVRSEPTTLGGAVQLPPNGLRLMEQLGLFQKLLARGFSSARLQIHSMRSEVLADWDRSEGTHNASDFGFMRILRKDLLEVLLEAAKQHEIPIHYSKSLTKIEETETDVTVITVSFADGFTESGEIVLGCDGIHSAVRSLLVDPDAKPVYSGIANMFGLLPMSAQELGIDPALHATMTPKGLVAMSPHTALADRLYWFFSRSVPIPDSGSRDGWEAFGKHEIDGFKNTLLEILADATGDWNDKLREVIRRTEMVKFYPIYKMPTESKWFSTRERRRTVGICVRPVVPCGRELKRSELESAFGFTKRHTWTNWASVWIRKLSVTTS
jgi:2-polyprenyl-6-methoxyphenol hydroxylase-like FAD-dependent oxidoreductase